MLPAAALYRLIAPVIRLSNVFIFNFENLNTMFKFKPSPAPEDFDQIRRPAAQRFHARARLHFAA
jgi:hypothetical protein